MKTALLIGGTGPTGPGIALGLAERGYEVTILHRGTHEHPDVMRFEHIHTDPHFIEPLEESLKGRKFDLTIGSYGRLRVTAKAMVDKTDRFIGVGGLACYRGFDNPEALFPRGMAVPTAETAPVVDSEAEARFAYLIASTEQEVLRLHPTASVFRYPAIYGPNQLVPREWSIVRRVIDKRPTLVLVDGGKGMLPACYSENAVHAVLLAADKPEASAGQIYNVADDVQFTFRQLAQVIADEMGYEFEVISLPELPETRDVAFNPMYRGVIGDPVMLDTFKLRHQLGYADRVSPVEGVRRTVRWLVENPLERGGTIERRMLDAFDYEAEDALIDLWRKIVPLVEALPTFKQREYFHAYAHPKVAGQGLDHNQR